MLTIRTWLRLAAIAVVALVIALVVARHDQRVLVRARTAAENESQRLREQLAAAQRESHRLSRELLAARDDAARAPAPRFEPAVGATAVREDFAGPPLAEMQRLHALHERAALDGRFAALFKALKLSPEKLARLKDLLVEREVAMGDVFAAAAAQGIDLHGDPAALERAIANARRDVDRSIQTLLGDEAYATYDDYRQTLAQRGVVDQLQQRLSYTPEPLTDAQSAQLLRILAATATPTPGADGPVQDAVFFGPAGAATLMNGAPISDAAVAQAQSFLSAQQLRALQELQAAQRTQQEIMQQMGPPGGIAIGGAISIGSPGPGRK